MNPIALDALARSTKRLEMPQWELPTAEQPAVTPASSYDSRTADKFVVRFPEGVRARIADQAEAEGRSMNSVVVLAVEQYLDNQEQHQIMMSALALLKQQLQDQLAAAKGEVQQ